MARYAPPEAAERPHAPAERPGDNHEPAEHEANSRGGGAWPRSLKRAIAVAVGLAVAHLLIWGGLLVTEGPDLYVRHHTDFLHILTGGLLVREGNGALLYDLDAQRAAQNRILAPYLTLEPGKLLPHNHPPFEALLIAPLMGLPYPVLYALWTLLALTAVGASLWLLSGTLPVVASVRWTLIAAVCSYHPLHIALWSGQTSPLMLLGLCGAYAALKRGREGWAGVALLLLTAKPQQLPVVLLLLLLLGRWRAVAIWAGLLAALGVAAMPVLGAAWPLHYLRFVAASTRLGENAYINPANMPTWRGLATDLIGGWAPALVMPLFAGLALASLGVLLWSWWRSRAAASPEDGATTPYAPRVDLLWALACLVAVLISFHLGPYDLVLLVLPAWLIAAYATTRRWGAESSALSLVLLWAGYAPPLLMLVAKQAVVLSVLPVATAAGLLAWQAAGRPGLREVLTGASPDRTLQVTRYRD